MTRIALLWHMHQPYYEDLVTGEHILPWVRLHGLKDYYGMVALLREFPSVRMTFNLVPSLLVQLQAFAENRARDRHLEVGLKPADSLTDEDRAFMISNFFHAQRTRMIEAYPRYRELFERREALGGRSSDAAIRTAARDFSETDLRDLQVWHKLAWIDPSYLDADQRILALLDKGRAFNEADKQTLREVELEILQRTIPEYRAAVERGQIEVSTSPFYHPILPLLCDTDVYLRTHPRSRMPRHRFRHPDDAAEQLVRASTYISSLFGQRPVGLWPSEGSVSEAIVPLAHAAGFTWLATDEIILERTLRHPFVRDSRGQLEEPELLYRPYTLRADGSAIHGVFRDHTLSDLIGFTYSSWDGVEAARDFTGRLREAGRRFAARTGGGEATIPVILDGENAWEHFPDGGRPFLRALYRALSDDPELHTVTCADACARSSAALDGLFPGSWINGDFYTWMGHADDHRAWDQLARARQALEVSAGTDAAAVARAREEVLIAEGSDWFWWYGDDHSSEHDFVFDDLFRRHLRNVYRTLGQPVPDELFATNITTALPPSASAVEAPLGLLHPTIDGEETSYFEWLGAGVYDARVTAGAMQQAGTRPIAARLLRFGFDLGHLYLRLDLDDHAGATIASTAGVDVTFLRPPDLRVTLAFGNQAATTIMRRGTDGSWTESSIQGARATLGRVLEVAIPLGALAVKAGDTISFFVGLMDGGYEIERHPPDRPIEALVPSADFEALHWTV